jgi:glycosyltransferase involved in cell wall biosynthesis
LRAKAIKPAAGFPLQLLFLTQSGAALPSVRFRVLPYLKRGEARGLATAWERIPKSILTRITRFARLRRAEIIVVQKKLLPPLYLRLLKRRCRHLYYDFDDAVWTHHPGDSGKATQAGRLRKAQLRFTATCRWADGIIAGNSYLGAKARVHNPQVTVLPTPIDTDIYLPGGKQRPDEQRLRVGWMGTAGNQHFLPPVLTTLNTIAEKIELRVISNENRLAAAMPGMLFEPWSAENEVAQLQDFDIGLMPLSDDEYTRGKCGFKLLQYMACGVVPIASAVGFNTEIIDHGVDGFLVQDAADWGRHISRIEKDPQMRRQMAAKARAKVEAKFSLTESARRLWRLFSL